MVNFALCCATLGSGAVYTRMRMGKRPCWEESLYMQETAIQKTMTQEISEDLSLHSYVRGASALCSVAGRAVCCCWSAHHMATKQKSCGQLANKTRGYRQERVTTVRTGLQEWPEWHYGRALQGLTQERAGIGAPGGQQGGSSENTPLVNHKIWAMVHGPANVNHSTETRHRRTD